MDSQKYKSLNFSLFFIGILFLVLLAGCDGLLQSRLSEGSSLNEGDGLPPGIFTLLYPPDGAIGIDLTPTLSWNPSTDPEGGMVYYVISLKDQQNAFKQDVTVQNTSYTVDAPLKPGKTYYWRVAAKDPKGNVRLTSFRSFTTAVSGGDASFSPILSQTNVRKGVITHHPSNPNYLVYTYINRVDLSVWSKISSDGGITWDNSIEAPFLPNTRDLAVSMNSNLYTGAMFIYITSDDTGTGARVAVSRLPYNSTWSNPTQVYSESGSAFRRLPSVVRADYDSTPIFGVGYDTSGPGGPNDTQAFTIYLDNTTNNFSSNSDLIFPSPPVDPYYCQQVSSDFENPSSMYYLYFTNSISSEIDGGDMVVVEGIYPATWQPYQYRVVDGSDEQRPSQGYLFKKNGYYILLYALEEGPLPPHSVQSTLFLRAADSLNGLDCPPNTIDSVLESSLAIMSNTNGRYRTVYAAQNSSGTIHIVWQDSSNKIKWSKIDTSSPPFTPTTPTTLALNRWLDSISVGNTEMYVSVVDSNNGYTGEVIKVPF